MGIQEFPKKYVLNRMAMLKTIPIATTPTLAPPMRNWPTLAPLLARAAPAVIVVMTTTAAPHKPNAALLMTDYALPQEL